jgi:hypothetical protein
MGIGRTVRWPSVLRNRYGAHRRLHQRPMESVFGVGIVSVE